MNISSLLVGCEHTFLLMCQKWKKLHHDVKVLFQLTAELLNLKEGSSEFLELQQESNQETGWHRVFLQNSASSD